MLIGVPKEIKTDEYRVGIVPDTVFQLSALGHEVEVETGAGEGAGIDDRQFISAGGRIVAAAEDIFRRADLIVKVKEPQPAERRMLRRGQMLFTYLHLAPDLEQTLDLMASGVTAIAYETVSDAAGRLPLLAPMSKVAGRMAAQVGAHFLERPQGGRGVLFGSVDSSPPAHVVILGGGVVGTAAADVAIGMGAQVTIVVHGEDSARRLLQQYGARAHVVVGSDETRVRLCLEADVLIGAALVAGAAAPKLVSAATVARMRQGAVLVDVSIDQGGCAETSRPTTHSEPTYTVGGVVHYCVANMPGAVPRTSTFALNAATAPYILDIANKGFPRAFADSAALRAGLNVVDGRITCEAVAQALHLPYVRAQDALDA